MKEEILKKYKDLLPSRITIAVEKSEEGLYVKIEDFPYCYTQADNQIELVDMINEAVFDYLDIPEEARGEIGYYVPATAIERAVR